MEDQEEGSTLRDFVPPEPPPASLREAIGMKGTFYLKEFEYKVHGVHVVSSLVMQAPRQDPSIEQDPSTQARILIIDFYNLGNDSELVTLPEEVIEDLNQTAVFFLKDMSVDFVVARKLDAATVAKMTEESVLSDQTNMANLPEPPPSEIGQFVVAPKDRNRKKNKWDALEEEGMISLDQEQARTRFMGMGGRRSRRRKSKRRRQKRGKRTRRG